MELELSGYNKEVAALHSGHYTQVQLHVHVFMLEIVTQALIDLSSTHQAPLAQQC